jgi:MoaA/NifB/PqqE/SkfB family radical SAM enzyme
MCALSDLLNSNGAELSITQYRDFIDSCAKYKPGFVLYGGEPFLKKDILDIMRIIKNHRLSCGVFTNGLLLNKNILKEIIQLKINFVVFSLYGPREIHDNIVGVKGAYDKVIENASFLKEHRKNTKVIIHCTISEQNIKHLGDISSISVCDKVRFGHLTFITEQMKQKIKQDLNCFLKDEEISLKTHIFNLDAEKSKEFVDNIISVKSKKNMPFTPELTNEEIANWYQPNFKTHRKCLFVWRGVFIAPNGDVYPCMGNFYYKMGNILTEDFLEIWNSNKFINFRRMLRKELLSACSRCCRL